MSSVIDNIIEKMNKITSSSIEGEEYVLLNKSYKSLPLDKSNFKNIISTSNENNIVFVDGGNAEIFASSNFSLQFIRTYFSVYNNNKKLRSAKFEFYVLIYSVVENDEVFYQFESFPLKQSLGVSDFAISSTDKAVCIGNNRTTPSAIAELIRRLLEIKTAEFLAGSLKGNDMIVLDGSLEAKTAYEKNALDLLYKKAAESGITIGSIAKTSRYFTNKGNNLLPLLSKIAPKGCWYYYPIADFDDENYIAEIYFARLHDRSSYIFRLELHKNNKIDMDSKRHVSEILSNLANNSKDSSFLGYPYGLIDADRFARVSNSEKQLMQTKLAAKIGSSFKNLKEHLSSIDAHSILDSF